MPGDPPNQPLRSGSADAWSAKRKFSRFNLPGMVQVIRRGFLGLKKTADAKIVDISEGGMGFMWPEEIAKGTRLELRIEVKEVKDLLEVEATVTRASPPLPIAKEQIWIISTEFDELPPGDQVKIAGWRSFFGSTMIRKKEDEKRKDFGFT